MKIVYYLADMDLDLHVTILIEKYKIELKKFGYRDGIKSKKY